MRVLGLLLGSALLVDASMTFQNGGAWISDKINEVVEFSVKRGCDKSDMLTDPMCVEMKAFLEKMRSVDSLFRDLPETYDRIRSASDEWRGGNRKDDDQGQQDGGKDDDWRGSDGKDDDQGQQDGGDGNNDAEMRMRWAGLPLPEDESDWNDDGVPDGLDDDSGQEPQVPPAEDFPREGAGAPKRAASWLPRGADMAAELELGGAEPQIQAVRDPSSKDTGNGPIPLEFPSDSVDDGAAGPGDPWLRNKGRTDDGLGSGDKWSRKKPKKEDTYSRDSTDGNTDDDDYSGNPWRRKKHKNRRRKTWSRYQKKTKKKESTKKSRGSGSSFRRRRRARRYGRSSDELPEPVSW